MPPHEVRKVWTVEVTVEVGNSDGPGLNIWRPVVVVDGRLLGKAPKEYRGTVLLFATGILEKKQNRLLNRYSLTGHRSEHGFEIGRITTVAHQVEPTAALREETSRLATDAVGSARRRARVRILYSRLATVVQDLPKV